MSSFADNQKIKKALKAIEPNEGLIEDEPLINFPLKGSSRPIEVEEKMRKNHSRSKTVYEYKTDKVT